MTASTSRAAPFTSQGPVRPYEAPRPTSDVRAPSFRERHSLRHRRLFLSKLKESAQPGPGVRVLDLGGGTGAATEVFAQGASEVVVLEPNLRRISRGRSARPSIAFLEGVAESLPFPDRRFDRVTSVLSFHHLKDGPKALAEAYRVLANGGRLVVGDFGSHSWQSRLFRFLHVVTLHGSLSFTDPAVVDSWLRSAGFVRIQREWVGSYYVLSAEK
jgi:ubiquinone/menaquinone biosynthesis C-methylase UbiE